MLTTFFQPEIFLSCIALFLLIFLIIKPTTHYTILSINISFIYSLVICLFLLVNLINTFFNDLLTCYFNSYFIVTKGLLEFKVLILLFNILYFYNFSKKIIKQNNVEIFYFNILFYLISMLLIISSNNFLIIFLGIELQNFITYILIATYKTKQTTLKSVFLYLILNSILGIFFLFSLLIIFSFCKTLVLNELQLILPFIFNYPFKITFWILFSFLLIFCIILFKLASAPFHFWVKDIYAGISISLIGFFNINTKLIFFFILVQLISLFNYSTLLSYFQLLCLFSGCLSLIIGSLLTIYQKTIKTFLVCSSITHIGYLLIIFSKANNLYILSSLYGYIFNYMFTLLILWSILSYFSEYTMQNDFYISELVSFFKYTPTLGLIFCFCLLSLAGIPPFIGFFFKYQIILAMLSNSIISFSFILFILLISVLSCYYYLIILKLIFFENIKKITFSIIYNIIQTESQSTLLTISFFILICSPFFYNILNTLISSLIFITFF